MRIQADKSQLAEAARVLARVPETLRKANMRTLFLAGERGVARIRRQYRMAGQTTATATASRTGALADAYGHETNEEFGGGLRLDIGLVKPGTDAKVLEYARVHEARGTTRIVPRRARHLAIPLPAAKTARGVARGGPRDFLDTFVRRSKAGNLIIFQNRADTIVPLFVLKDFVKIKGRPALRPVFDRHVRPEVEAGVQENFTASFGALGR